MGDVNRLRDEANRMPLDSAVAARNRLVESVRLGQDAFADKSALDYASWLVEAFFS
jgi:ankyrin repeat protein